MIERHLDECVKCATEVDQHHEVAALLANSGGPSPVGLWEGIAARLDGASPPAWERLASRLQPGEVTGESGVGESGVGDPAGPSEATAPDATPPATVVPITRAGNRNRMLVRVGTVVAAAAAVVAVVLGVQVHHLHQQVSALQSHSQLSAVEQAALRDPSTRTVDLTAATSTTGATGKVVVVLTKSGTGFVEAGGLSTLASDRTYQLWAVIGNQTISLGLLGSQPKVVPFSVAGSAPVNAFAITAEHAGGVVHSTNQPVVAGEVSV
jgi:anti-sigma-K factor RskA